MDTVSQIKQNLDITDVIAGYISVKKSGKNYKALCPFHSEDTPSFMVSPELQIYKCFGCGEAGDIFNFVEKMEGVDFNSALEILAEKAGVKIERRQHDPNYKKKAKAFEINLMAAEFYHYLLMKHKSGRKALEYLKKKRGFDDRTIRAFKLGYAPNTWDTLYQFLNKKGHSDENLLITGVVMARRSGEGFIDKFRGRIVFPFVDVSGKIVGYSGRDVVGRDPKYLNTQETIVFNKSAFLYGLDKAKAAVKKDGAIFVEGQMDVIKAWQNDITNVVAASGTSLTSVQLKIISRYTKELTFCFDSDDAGLNATARALALAEPFDFDVKVAMIPESYDDLDDYLKESAGAAKKALKNPIPIYDFYLANALKRYKKETAYGKKRIVEYLAPVFSKISNNVVLDHYVKELSEKISTSEEAIRGALKEPKEFKSKEDEKKSKENAKMQQEMKKSPEEYLLALLLKARLDTMGQFLYKLDSEDFTVERNTIIFEELKKYIDSKPKEFDIKYFTEKIDPKFKELTLEMYLWDLGDLTSNRILFVREIESAISRIEKESIKRKLKKISEQIKLAELETDAKKIEELSKEFSELSKKLI